jgi:hypothetical protein
LPTKGVYDFLLSYFECHQSWLNLLMDDHHLSNITKLGKFIFYKNNESACDGGNFLVIRVTKFFASQSMVWVCLVLWISKTFSSSHFSQ